MTSMRIFVAQRLNQCRTHVTVTPCVPTALGLAPGTLLGFKESVSNSSLPISLKDISLCNLGVA